MIRILLALCLLLSVAGTALAAVNANTATVDELQGITGIGPTIAQRIVDERRNGPYRSLEDLQSRVRGIGETTIRKMGAAGLTVSGGTTGARRGAGTAGGARGEVIEVPTGGAPKGVGSRESPAPGKPAPAAGSGTATDRPKQSASPAGAAARSPSASGTGGDSRPAGARP